MILLQTQIRLACSNYRIGKDMKESTRKRLRELKSGKKVKIFCEFREKFETTAQISIPFCNFVQ